jgi:uncharacterized protein (TIGR00266 family)
MKYHVNESSFAPMISVYLNQGESIKMESGSMVYHNGLIELEGRTNSSTTGVGGLLRAAVRSAVSNESIFITHAFSRANGGVIGLAPSKPGAIYALKCGGNTQHRINDGAFLACDATVDYQIRRQNFGKAVFGGTGGFFVMETNGNGTMLVNAFGDIVEFALDGSNPLIVDNTHVVAWDASLSYNIRVASGMFGFKTGEGLVNEFRGVGKVLVQTRSITEFAAILSPMISSGS